MFPASKPEGNKYDITQAPRTNILLHLLLSPNYETVTVIRSAESGICLVGTGRKSGVLLVEARLTPSDQTYLFLWEFAVFWLSLFILFWVWKA